MSTHNKCFCGESCGNPTLSGTMGSLLFVETYYPVSILYKSIAGRYWPVRVADGPITACYRFIKTASWVQCLVTLSVVYAKKNSFSS